MSSEKKIADNEESRKAAEIMLKSVEDNVESEKKKSEQLKKQLEEAKMVRTFLRITFGGIQP